eukprot:gnl/TRDRNA2_/TRDRNA2_58797_c1_seq1.p1 gnl/TRDRNA2_/TRDRNA2_58797_c1~~gnl/TRDRNA2_/TRDRNA2_58797_c1_seq1.p1  ORF type:complete len:244 (-),score=29.72 gnl/TRDRNA2_/TRDRNA2_58797_c1_seq1:82-780(-)
MTVTEDTPNRTVIVDRYRYGVLINIQPASGIMSRFDINRVVTSLCNFSVLMGFPPMIVSFVVFFLLGQRSKLFRRGQRRIIEIQDLYRSFAYTALIADQIFQGADEDGTGFLGHTELYKKFSRLLLPHLLARYPDKSRGFYEERLRQFVDLLVKDFTIEKADGTHEKQRGVSHEEFLKFCTQNEPLDWADIMDKLADPKIDAPPGKNLCRRFAKVAPREDAKERWADPVAGG